MIDVMLLEQLNIVGYLILEDDGREFYCKFAHWAKIGGSVKQVFPPKCIGFVALVGREYITFRLEHNDRCKFRTVFENPHNIANPTGQD